MLTFLKIAWRNIIRNRRRTLVTLAAITFGLASILVFFGFTDGFHTQWIDNSVKAYSGHILIHTDGFHDDPHLSKSIKNLPLVLERISAEKTLKSYTTRVDLQGLASTAENSAGVMIRGIDTEREAEIAALDKRIIEGSYLDESKERGILLGHRLAKRLKCRLGDKVVIMIQAADGSLGAELFRLGGVFRLGAIDLDSTLAIITLKDARNLAVLGDSVTEVALIVKRPEDVPGATERLKELEESGYEVLPWQEVMPYIREMVELDNAFMYVMLLIVLVVVSLGMLNTMLMSIMERTREFGIMMALGTRPKQIVGLIMLESLLISLIGTLAGVVVGIGTNELIAINGLDLSRWADAMELLATLDPTIYPETHFISIFLSAITIFLTAIIVSIYPAVRAARLKPVDAIHHI